MKKKLNADKQSFNHKDNRIECIIRFEETTKTSFNVFIFRKILIFLNLLKLQL